MAHARDELRLVLARQFELVVLVLDFVEQPYVLDCDHRLVREGLDERDLLVSERLEFQSVDGDGSNKVVPFQHRNGECRPDWPLVSHSIGILRIALDVRDVYCSPLEGSNAPRCCNVPERSGSYLRIP